MKPKRQWPGSYHSRPNYLKYMHQNMSIVDAQARLDSEKAGSLITEHICFTFDRNCKLV